MTETIEPNNQQNKAEELLSDDPFIRKQTQDETNLKHISILNNLLARLKPIDRASIVSSVFAGRHDIAIQKLESLNNVISNQAILDRDKNAVLYTNEEFAQLGRLLQEMGDDPALINQYSQE